MTQEQGLISQYKIGYEMAKTDVIRNLEAWIDLNYSKNQSIDVVTLKQKLKQLPMEVKLVD